MSPRTVVFAGGGTAGHIQPALAVAQQWRREYPEDQIIFLGTSSGLESSLIPTSGFELQLITRVRVPRNFSLNLLRIPGKLLCSIFECRRVLKDADLLIGFGGYVSAPAYLAAASGRTPIVIHEANAKPGWANRLGALFTKSLAVGIPVSDGAFSSALITGIPLREDIAEVLDRNRDMDVSKWQDLQAQAKTSLGFDSQRPLLLVFGGSQGSQMINSVIQTAAPRIIMKSISILHSVGGSNDLPTARENYTAVSYIHDMATAYVAADLVIARSGAITCSEVSALGKFTIFVPLAVGNGEQGFNALDLVARERAVVIEQKSFTATWLVDNIDSMIKKSIVSPLGVDYSDLDAAEKIVALMENALRKIKA
jgi:UDP-N-acetylglucosamine--N-acetylmuramyl-(pentapeptide) pyrophosphoryl-undecaprenol N-acetylglucosamine transferase